ncbi:hypothetical protein EII22_09010 [Coriobacteriales bacterium OH1046]|nr:hypothetical protein EII22_09010 [Coriobacteriales bacterium OH1046]
MDYTAFDGGMEPADHTPEDPMTGEDLAPATFDVLGRTYEISLTKARIDLYEQRHRPIMASFIQNGGAFSAAELEAILAYGLRVEGGPFVNPKRGMEMAGQLMQSNGYLAVLTAVMDALQRDCGFLFR